MKKLFFPAVFFACFQMQDTVAQSKQQETIVIEEKDSKENNRIVVEIKNGEIFIDGKKITPKANGKNLRIIKEFKNGIADNNTDIEIKIPELNGIKSLDGLKELEGLKELNFDGFNWDQGGPSNRAILGVVTEQSAENKGAKIIEVSPQSAAEIAGLQPGDVIDKVGSQVITGPEDLVTAIAAYEGGEKINIQLNRGGKEINQDVTLSSKPQNGTGMMNGGDFFQGFEEMMKGFKGFDAENGMMKSFSFGSPLSEESPKLGMQVEDRADGEGVRVLQVTQNGAAEKSGIIIDDVITLFNSQPINNIQDLTKAIMDGKNSKEVKVEIKRNGKAKLLKIEMPQILRKKDF
jgi:serine protease Do